jgi:dephospho-CoA kinase
MLIGVTGSIGSGKSLVARLLSELLPAPVVSSDEICRSLLEKGEAGYRAFTSIWGDRFLSQSGDIDRVLLRTAVFDNDDIRIQLEEILHPLVRQALLDLKRNIVPSTIHVAEVPLLFECGWQSDFDTIVCVLAEREVTLQRVVQRDSAQRSEVEKILKLQMDPAVKAEQSDWVVDNSGTVEQTTRQVAALVEPFGELATRCESR